VWFTKELRGGGKRHLEKKDASANEREGKVKRSRGCKPVCQEVRGLCGEKKHQELNRKGVGESEVGQVFPNDKRGDKAKEKKGVINLYVRAPFVCDTLSRNWGKRKRGETLKGHTGKGRGCLGKAEQETRISVRE